MARTNQFTEALLAADPVELKQAIERCAEREGAPHRTTFNRWLTGTVPPRGEFVQLLADELGDPTIYQSWVAVKAGRTTSPVDEVVGSFEGLSEEQQAEVLSHLDLRRADEAGADEEAIVASFAALGGIEAKDAVFHQIRGQYLTTLPRKRSRPVYTIELVEPAAIDPENDDHFLIKLSLTWTGAIPPRANIQVVAEQKQLGKAYDDANCIFREIVMLDRMRLQQILGAGRAPVLNINRVDGDAPIGQHYTAEHVEGGMYAFANEEEDNARVRLTLTYPHPRGRPVYYINLGNYQVPDVVDIVLTLSSERASEPRAFPYMPPGRRRAWSSSVTPDELTVTLGTGDTVFGDGDGVVLSWTEQPL